MGIALQLPVQDTVLKTVSLEDDLGAAERDRGPDLRVLTWEAGS